jgi:hypothetical protein
MENAMRLLSVNADAKTVKGVKRGYLTGILYLAPARVAGGPNMCPFADRCMDPCLNTSGRGGMNTTQRARIRKTRWYIADRMGFEMALAKDIEALERKAKREGLTPVVRVNGTSDQPRLARDMAIAYPNIMFYDYTKVPNPWGRERANYRLTYSYDGPHRTADAKAALEHGINVAVVFDTKKGAHLPRMWWGRKVVDGDETDLRFLDPRGVVVGLRAKGRARKDRSGFVVRLGE